MILIGESSLRRALSEFDLHYLAEDHTVAHYRQEL
jgi:trimethylamine:corrinoid methyltransferase-like protein